MVEGTRQQLMEGRFNDMESRNQVTEGKIVTIEGRLQLIDEGIISIRTEMAEKINQLHELFFNSPNQTAMEEGNGKGILGSAPSGSNHSAAPSGSNYAAGNQRHQGHYQPVNRAHMSAGWVPNQGGLQQQNGNALPPNQMQNLVGGVAPVAASGGVGVVPQQHNMLTMDPELLRARGFMRDRIFSILLHRHSQPIDEITRNKFKDISIRLEGGLFKAAHTKEDYMNMETLEPRLSSLIKGRSGNNHNQRHQQLVNSTSSIATMIPTPGMTHSGNSPMMFASSIDSSMIAASGGNTIPPATVTTGSLLSTGGIQSGSFNRSDEEDHVNMDELSEDVSNLNIEEDHVNMDELSEDVSNLNIDAGLNED